MSIDKNSRAARQMNGQPSRTPSRRTAGGRSSRSTGRRPSGSSGRRLSGSGSTRSADLSNRRSSGSSGSRGRGTGRKPGRRYSKKKRMAPWKIVLLTGLLLIVTSVSGAVYYVNHLMGKTTDLGVDMEEKTNPNLDIETKKVQKGFWKVAVFGLDSTDGNLGRGANSDVIIICSLNWETGEIKMASVYRDTYLKVGEKNPYRKINEAYARGGPDQAIEALNENLDIEVDDFVSVNWKVVADCINVLGGVDIEVTDAEFTQINGYITSVVENTGVYSQHLKAPGFQHLDGVQAVAYCRLRKMDTDFRRTERQRAVISQCLEKAKKADLKVLNSAIGLCFSQIATTVDMRDVMDLAMVINRFHLGETTGFPFDLKLQDIGKLDCVVPVTLTSNVVKLHQFLFGTENYKPSEHVQRISEDIAYNSAKQADSGENLHQEDIERMNSTTKAKEESSTKAEERTTEKEQEREPADETDEPDEQDNLEEETDEYVPEDELINDPGLRTHPDESSSGADRNNPTASRESESRVNGTERESGESNASRPSSTQEGTSAAPGNHTNESQTGPGGNPSSGPGGSTQTRPGETSPSGPGGNTTHGPGAVPTQPTAPSGNISDGPGAPGNSSGGSRGTVYTTRPVPGESERGNEGGPGYVN